MLAYKPQQRLKAAKPSTALCVVCERSTSYTENIRRRQPDTVISLFWCAAVGILSCQKAEIKSVPKSFGDTQDPGDKQLGEQSSAGMVMQHSMGRPTKKHNLEEAGNHIVTP